MSTTLAVYALPEDAVAVILQALPAAAEAVKRPPVVMLPQDVAHLTAALAVNCWVSPSAVVALAGVILMGELIVAVVDAEAPPPEVGLALTVQAPAVSGAVYAPVLATMLPQLAVHVATTLAVNVCAAPSLTVGADGVISTAGAAPMVSTTLAVYALPDDAVAVIVQAVPGADVAVNRPPAVMLPQDAAHLTVELAVNCCV